MFHMKGVRKMKLLFLYHSVQNANESVTFYRDVMGWEEAWREGTDTVCFHIPDSPIRLLIDKDDNPKSGGFFHVDNVDAFYEENRDRLNFTVEPRDIPPGRFAAFEDPSGNIVRLLDFTKDSE
jgi:catechol 2,3-dioxygenase-like lactoylglutathione lyase family enzyme